MNQHSMATEQISTYLSSRSSNHMIQSMALGNPLSDNNNSTNNNYFSEIQMDDGKWTRHQTQILIDTWKEHKDILLSTASSSAEHFRVWKLIATEVNKFAPPKSLQQCKKKFRNIRYICKMAMNNNKQEGGKKHYPMFYTDFLEIIAESERIKEGIKTESPNVEVLNDSSKDGDLYSTNYNNTSPQCESQSQYESRTGRSPTELSLRRSEEDSDERRGQISGGNNINTSDGSYNGSPQSRECDQDYPSTSPTMQNSTHEGNGERTIDGPAPLQNGDIENGHARISERYSNYYSHHDSMYSPIYSSNSEHYMRKHKNIDVSIMGRGYPTAKRVKRTMDLYPSSVPAPYKYSSRNQRGYPPTMANISGNSYPYHLNNHYSTTPPLIRPVSTPKDTSPTPRNNVVSATNNHVTSLPNETPYKEAAQSQSYLNDGLPPLKSSPGFKSSLRSTTPPKDLTFTESLSFYNQRFIDIQERQTELFSEMLSRHEQFLLRLLEQQREAAEEAQKRDREFMLKLIEMFVKH